MTNLNQINAFANANPFGNQNALGEFKPKGFQQRQNQSI